MVVITLNDSELLEGLDGYQIVKFGLPSLSS